MEAEAVAGEANFVVIAATPTVRLGAREDLRCAPVDIVFTKGLV